jgi:hypothetical protein
MADRREMGRDAADPRTHSETTTGRGETTGRQPGHLEGHESRSSAGNEAQVAGILHGSQHAPDNPSDSSGRWSDASDATSHQNAHMHSEGDEHQHGRSHPANVEQGESPQKKEPKPTKKRGRKAA